MKKTVQYFTKEYLEQCAKLSPEQILEFLEDYKMLVANVPQKCKPISLKIEPALLNTFKQKASLHGVAYQTKIKQLMKEWIEE